MMNHGHLRPHQQSRMSGTVIMDCELRVAGRRRRSQKSHCPKFPKQEIRKQVIISTTINHKSQITINQLLEALNL